ncbi:hypothetical protein OU995_21375 [Roseateles sp. SL47]|uniref:hypothetical protein n=1 Tax=Roseateles sp. SL47 TaxID=2995138 RepID=UPI00226ED7EC|nr:hypothetical protein [Roseateles sp. SL47]WAC72095.1 hypothetical protein OU995_21375 [Roseateles sp. SL47]
MDRMTYSAEKELADATAELAHVLNQEVFNDPFPVARRGVGVRGNLAAKQAAQQRAHENTRRISELKARINELRTRIEDQHLEAISNASLLERMGSGRVAAEVLPDVARETA